MSKKFEIRNSTAEFLIFQIEGKEDGVQVMYRDETIWCSQKAMAQLFDCSTDNIGLHLKNIFKSGELQEDSVTEKFSATASDGKNYLTNLPNLSQQMLKIVFADKRTIFHPLLVNHISTYGKLT